MTCDWVEEATAAPAAAGSQGDWAMPLDSGVLFLGSIEGVVPSGGIGVVHGVVSGEDTI